MIRCMKKIVFILLVLIVNYAAYSQGQYGILFISDIEARNELEETAGMHQIAFDNDRLYFYPNSLYTPVFAREDFFYVLPNLTTKKIKFFFTSNHQGCFIDQIIEFDIENKTITGNNNGENYFMGCFATTDFYLIYATSTDTVNSSKCPEDVIELNNGWNWQYSFDSTIWVDFAADFQEQRSISFKIKELADYEDKIKVYFRTGYKTKFTNIMPYDITPCTPKITQTSSPNLTSCSYANDGAVTFTFERELHDGEQYEMSLKYDNSTYAPYDNKTITKNLMTNPTTYTWTNLPAEKYILTYYTKKTVGSKEYLSNPPQQKSFTISSAPLFSFSATETQPKCYGEKATITITATGGTSPFYYYLNDDPKIEFTSPITIEVSAGNNSIKVEDNKNCIDNTKNDTKS